METDVKFINQQRWNEIYQEFLLDESEFSECLKELNQKDCLETKSFFETVDEMDGVLNQEITAQNIYSYANQFQRFEISIGDQSFKIEDRFMSLYNELLKDTILYSKDKEKVWIKRGLPEEAFNSLMWDMMDTAWSAEQIQSYFLELKMIAKDEPVFLSFEKEKSHAFASTTHITKEVGYSESTNNKPYFIKMNLAYSVELIPDISELKFVFDHELLHAKLPLFLQENHYGKIYEQSEEGQLFIDGTRLYEVFYRFLGESLKRTTTFDNSYEPSDHTHDARVIMLRAKGNSETYSLLNESLVVGYHIEITEGAKEFYYNYYRESILDRGDKFLEKDFSNLKEDEIQRVAYMIAVLSRYKWFQEYKEKLVDKLNGVPLDVAYQIKDYAELYYSAMGVLGGYCREKNLSII